jgi:flagellar biosynthesis protein FlhG
MTGPQLEAFLAELSNLESFTDYLIFDTGAGLGEDVLMFCEASDEVILVITPEPASLADAYAIAKTLFNRDPNKKIGVVMNMVNDEAHAKQVYARIYSICKQFLSKSVKYIGFVRFDREAQLLIRSRKPFLLANPNCAASRDVAGIAKRLLGLATGEQKTSLFDRLRSAFSQSRDRKTA